MWDSSKCGAGKFGVYCAGRQPAQLEIEHHSNVATKVVGAAPLPIKTYLSATNAKVTITVSATLGSYKATLTSFNVVRLFYLASNRAEFAVLARVQFLSLGKQPPSPNLQFLQSNLYKVAVPVQESWRATWTPAPNSGVFWYTVAGPNATSLQTPTGPVAASAEIVIDIDSSMLSSHPNGVYLLAWTEGSSPLAADSVTYNVQVCLGHRRLE